MRTVKSFIIFALTVALLGQPLGAQTISNIRPLTLVATLSAANAGTCSATTTACAVLLVGGFSSVSIQVTGNASSNTLQFEMTLDELPSASSVWVALNMTPPNSVTPVTSTTSTGLWSGPMNASAVRVRMSTLVAGTAVVAMRATFGAVARNNGGFALSTANPADQTGNATATFKMNGLGAAGAPCTITPLMSGRIVFTIDGDLTNSVILDGVTYKLAYGTGAAPANAAALTGTILGATRSVAVAVAAQKQGFSITREATGLSLVATWYDLQIANVTGGTASVSNITCVANEI